MTLAQLRSRVAARYERLGLPAWPDPHPGMASPLRQEYSRLTDPGRYRIGPARARVWTEVLGAQPGISVAPLAPADLDDEGRLGRCDRGVRISSPRPGTLPVLLLTCDVRSASTPEPLPVVHICVVRPDVALTVQPSCGCDACDSGSDDLLGAIDDAIGQVVGGPFVALRAANWRANWHPEGANAEGTAPGLDFSALMGLCRRLAEGQDVPPPGAEVFIGHSWFE